MTAAASKYIPTSPSGPRKDGGESSRQQGGYEAIGVGHPRADRDQGEHVETAGQKRGPGARKEGRPAPKHDRRRERQLQPRRSARREHVRERAADQLIDHAEEDERERECDAEPEAPRHGGELGVLLRGSARQHGLKRHAADGTAPRPVAHDLRMHGAGPRAGSGCSSCRPVRRAARVIAPAQICRGLGKEPLAALGSAEVVALARMLAAVLGRGRVDQHAAHGIRHQRGRPRRGRGIVGRVHFVRRWGFLPGEGQARYQPLSRFAGEGGTRGREAVGG